MADTPPQPQAPQPITQMVCHSRLLLDWIFAEPAYADRFTAIIRISILGQPYSSAPRSSPNASTSCRWSPWRSTHTKTWPGHSSLPQREAGREQQCITSRARPTPVEAKATDTTTRNTYGKPRDSARAASETTRGHSAWPICRWRK